MCKRLKPKQVRIGRAMARGWLAAAVSTSLSLPMVHAETPPDPDPDPGLGSSAARNRPPPVNAPDASVHLLNHKEGRVEGILVGLTDGYVMIEVQLSKNPPRVDVKRFPFSQEGLMERELPKLIGAKIQGRLVRDNRGRFHLKDYTVLEAAPPGGALMSPTPAP